VEAWQINLSEENFGGDRQKISMAVGILALRD